MLNIEEALKRICPFMSDTRNLTNCMADSCMMWEWVPLPQQAPAPKRKKAPVEGNCRLCHGDDPRAILKMSPLKEMA